MVMVLPDGLASLFTRRWRRRPHALADAGPSRPSPAGS
jgi:hypothetical protein